MNNPSRITKNVSVCGGHASIRDTCHTVADLVLWKRLGLSDERILEHYPDLCPHDLAAAWTYCEAHKDEIEADVHARINSRPEQPANGCAQLTPEVLERVRQEFSDEELAASLREIRASGGLELKDFIHELRQAGGLPAIGGQVFPR
jgi:uncharacterized protein (DUF433 family)